MNPIRLDTLAKTLSATPTRRAVFGAVLALATALPSVADTVAKKHKGKGKKQCKPKCPACKRCVKGKCRQKAISDACRSPRCGTGAPCRVFVTGKRYGANLGGLTGADAICQAEAELAGLSGAYKAWLADESGGPSERFRLSAGPYQLVTGETVADDWTDLTAGALRHAIDTNAAGAMFVSTEYSWTNTTPYGTRSGANDCANWTSDSAADFGDGVAGRIDQVDATWTEYTSFACNFELHLYCFQQS
jgi:hypothetical protein